MSSHAYLRSYSRTTPEIITVDVRNYMYDNSNNIHVDCYDYCFVLRRTDLALLGFANTPSSELVSADRDIFFVDNLEKYYSFLEVVKAFIRGKRGDYLPTETSEKEELQKVLSLYRLDYCKFVTLSMSKEHPEKIRNALNSLIGKIIVDFSERTLQSVFAMKGNLTLTEFLLKILREC